MVVQQAQQRGEWRLLVEVLLLSWKGRKEGEIQLRRGKEVAILTRAQYCIHCTVE